MECKDIITISINFLSLLFLGIYVIKTNTLAKESVKGNKFNKDEKKAEEIINTLVDAIVMRS